MPPSLADIVQAIGTDATLILVQRFGGQRLWIPSTPSQELIDLLGDAAALALCELCGGNQLDLPTCRNILLEQRNLTIRLERQHLTINQIAAKHGLTRRQVIRICR